VSKILELLSKSVRLAFAMAFAAGTILVARSYGLLVPDLAGGPHGLHYLWGNGRRRHTAQLLDRTYT
jgi:hypothetical protein